MSSSLSLLLSRLSKEEHRYIAIALQRYKGDSQLYRCYRLLKKGAGRMEILQSLEMKEHDFTVLCSKLKVRILDILADFSSSQNTFLRLIQMRRRVEVLIAKGLLREAEKQTEKLRVKAATLEIFWFEVEALHLKRLLMAQRNYSEISREELLKMKSKLKKKTSAFQQLSEFQFDSSLLFMQFYRDGHLNETSDTYQSFLRESAGHCESSLARYVWHNTRGFLYGRKDEAQRSIFEQKMAIEALMQLPIIDNERWYYLISAINNICIALCNAGDFHSAKDYREKLRQLPGKRKRLSYRESIFWWQHILALDFYMMLEGADFKRLDQLLTNLHLALKQHDFSKWYRAYFYYSAAYALFIVGRFDDALQWILLLLQNPHKEIPEEIYRFFLLLHALIHFESGNFEIASVLLENHKRKLRKTKNIYRLESLFTRFLLRAVRANGHKLREMAVACLCESRKLLNENAQERKVLDYLNMDIYLEALASAASFYRIYQEKKNKDV